MLEMLVFGNQTIKLNAFLPEKINLGFENDCFRSPKGPFVVLSELRTRKIGSSDRNIAARQS